MRDRRDSVRGGLSPFSPAGQVETWADLAQGWKTNRRGRRRLLGLAVVLAAETALVIAFV